MISPNYGASRATCMTTPLDQLQTWMDAKEDEHLEFKEAKNNFHFETLVKYCVALANEGGGRMILGVTDKRAAHGSWQPSFSRSRTDQGWSDRATAAAR